MQTRSEVINEFGEQIGQLLTEGGYASISAVMQATDEELLAIVGFGPASLEQVREKAPFMAPEPVQEVSQVSQQIYQYDTEYEVVQPFNGYEPGDTVMNLSRNLGLEMVKAGKIRKKRGGLEGFSNPRPTAVARLRARRERLGAG